MMKILRSNYMPRRSDLNVLKDGGVIAALAMITGTMVFIVRGLM